MSEAKIQLVLECGHVVHDYAPSRPSSKRTCWQCPGNPRRRVAAPTAAELRSPPQYPACEFVRGSGRNDCHAYTIRRADWCAPCLDAYASVSQGGSR